jgi:hypothetical protein
MGGIVRRPRRSKVTKTRRAAARPPAVVPYETPGIGDATWNLRESSLFLDDRGPVWDTLFRLTARLNAAGIPYAVIGAMAVNAHQHRRVTTDIDLVVTAEARRRIHELLDGRGFLPPFEGSRNLRDTTNGVKIDLVLAGDFPGDGKPKPVAFPDPSVEPVFVKDGVRYVTAEKLVELKLASGISHTLRYKDLGDVVSLIGSARLPREFGDRLHPWVQPKWFEIWDAWDADPRKDDF